MSGNTTSKSSTSPTAGYCCAGPMAPANPRPWRCCCPLSSTGTSPGYVWVEFGRDNADGTTDVITCGVGLRATEKARAATSWFFTTPRRVGHDLALENAAGPLSQPALSAALEDESGASRVFDNPRHYREHVGALLFGLPLDQYESLLRLLYWLRQPQVGEDIDPRRLAEQLVHALPTLDGDTVSAAGTTFDELEAFGEDIDRRERAAAALATFVETYAAYARSVVTDRTRVALEAAPVAIDAAEQAQREAASRIAALEQSPEAQARTDLAQSAELVQTLEKAASDLRAVADKAHVRAQASAREASAATDRLMDRAGELHDASKRAEAALAACGAEVPPGPTAAQVLGCLAAWESDEYCREQLGLPAALGTLAQGRGIGGRARGAHTRRVGRDWHSRRGSGGRGHHRGGGGTQHPCACSGDHPASRGRGRSR